MKINPLSCIDFYKTGHHVQYPLGTEYIYANFTPRSAINGVNEYIICIKSPTDIKTIRKNIMEEIANDKD